MEITPDLRPSGTAWRETARGRERNETLGPDAPDKAHNPTPATTHSSDGRRSALSESHSERPPTGVKSREGRG
eukprot:4053521-Alexandrium_andersonii.AAC.1